jgi:hypothetical protein
MAEDTDIPGFSQTKTADLLGYGRNLAHTCRSAAVLKASRSNSVSSKTAETTLYALFSGVLRLVFDTAALRRLARVLNCALACFGKKKRLPAR